MASHEATKKTAQQLDDEIEEALELAQIAERQRMNDELGKLSPREQELVLSAQEISEFGEILRNAGLHIDHKGRGTNGRLEIYGKPTYQLREVLKRYGFRFDGASKRWTKPKDYTRKDIDYLTLYRDLVGRL